MKAQKLVEMRTVTITEKGQIAIPKDVRKSAGFKTGSKVAVIAFEGRIELLPVKQLEGMLTAIASEKVLAKDWNRKEEEKAWKNL